MKPGAEASEGALQAASHQDGLLRARERRYLILLSFGLGFSQGCGLCFYVGSGGYFSALFDNPRFFIDACAFFYLPPILATLAQLLLDHRLDAWLGVRPVIRFRIIFSSLVLAVLLALMSIAADAPPYKGQGKLVFVFGAALGTFAALLLGASCVLFGAVDPRFVPYLVLGQTTAGIYTNAVARLLAFQPGCETWRARAFFLVAMGTVLAITAAYQVFSSCKLLENTYLHHEYLLVLSRSRAANAAGYRRSMHAPGGSGLEPLVPGRALVLGFPPVCWAMAACQSLAIAMNMSLTPLSNQVAKGEYLFSQELVLTKLAADFVGRGLFLLLPRPRLEGRGVRRLPLQAAFVALLELLRLPLWLAVFLRALGSASPAIAFLVNKEVLLWPVWLPLISSGALSASMCFVIAVTAAPEDKKKAANLLMSCSVYTGFFVGISIALLSG